MSPAEAVRYRGALSCKDCALSQKPVKEFNETPYYSLASFGCLVGLIATLYAMLHALQYAHQGPSIYVPPLVIYLGALFISVPLQSLGLLALNRVDLPKVAAVSFIVGILATAILVASLYDWLTTGPYYLVEEVVLIKDYYYYGWANFMYVLFIFTAGAGILLYVGRISIENSAIATAGLYFLAGGLNPFGYVLPPVGPVHSLLYAVAFIFFFTRKEVNERQPVETLDYRTVAAQ